MGEGFERQRAEAAALIEALDRKKQARTLAVPTDDRQVKARLRSMGEPAILFGEGVSRLRARGKRILTGTCFVMQPGDRRDRLKHVLQEIQAARGEGMDVDDSDDDTDSDEEVSRSPRYVAQLTDSASQKAEEFYTPGSDDLLKARRKIAEFSLARYVARLADTK
jgi:U4/U6 small nuclear ribonucleoprotein PRP4